MNTQIFKAGIIGFGYMGRFHLAHTKYIDGLEIIAAYDTDSQKLKDAASHGLRIYHTIDELLSCPSINLIIICTPNDSHKFYSMKALNAGKNVLCEKPAALNAAEVQEVIDCANKNQKFYTVHQNRRWDPDFLVVQKILETQTIGTFTTINSCTYGQRGVCFGWRANPESGGGMLYDWGVHLIDQMLLLYNSQKVIQIYGRLESILTPAVDDFFEAKLFFENHTCANISVGTFALEPLPRWFVFGTRGTLKLDDFSGTSGGMSVIKKNVIGFESVIGQKNLGPSRTMAHLEPENLETLSLPDVDDCSLFFYNNLLAALREDAPLSVTSDQILRVMKIIDAVFLSAKENQIIHTFI